MISPLSNFIFWKKTVVSFLNLVFFFFLVPVAFMVMVPLITGDAMVLSVSSAIFDLSYLFILVLLIISLLVFSWSSFYIVSSFKLSMFYLMLFLFVMTMILLLSSASALLLTLGWEGLGLTSLVLIIFYQNWNSFNSGVITLMTNRLGDSLLLILIVIWLQFMSLSGFFLVLMSIMAMTKSAQWPFFSWLPAAMAAPTPVSALVHSSTLVTAGIWVLSMFMCASKVLLNGLFFFGVSTMLIASFSAMLEQDMKKLVAMSTLSQLGFMFYSLVSSNIVITIFHILSHALAKANLFIVVGSILFKSFSNQDSRAVKGISLSSPMKLSGLLSLMSLSGIMFLSGFFSKEQILMKMVKSFLMLMFIVYTVGLTLVYSMKIYFILLASEKLVNSFLSESFKSFPVTILGFLMISFGYIYNSFFSSFLLQSNINSMMWLFFTSIFFAWFSGSYKMFFSGNPKSQFWFIFSLKSISSKIESTMVELISSTMTSIASSGSFKGGVLFMLVMFMNTLYYSV